MSKENEWFVFLANFGDKQKARKIYKLGYKKGQEAERLQTSKIIAEKDKQITELKEHYEKFEFVGAKEAAEQIKAELKKEAKKE